MPVRRIGHLFIIMMHLVKVFSAMGLYLLKSLKANCSNIACFRIIIAKYYPSIVKFVQVLVVTSYKERFNGYKKGVNKDLIIFTFFKNVTQFKSLLTVM